MLKNLWQQLDHYRCIETKCPEDAAILKNCIEKDQVYDFLVGLNAKFDQVQVQYLAKSFQLCMRLSPLFKQKKAREVSCLNLRIGSAMVANKGSDKKASTIDNKKTDWLGALNRDNRDNLWCTYH